MSISGKFWALFVAWVSIQVYGAVYGGVALGTDSPRYIESGLALFSSGALDARAAPYLSYIFLVGISDWLGFGLSGVVMIQLFAAAAALWFVFDLGRSVGGEWGGFWAVVPVATFLDFTQWHHFILTDSLSASLTVSCVWLLYRSCAGSVWWPYFFLLPLLTVGALLRPNGWLVVLLAIVAIAFSFSATWLVRGLTAAGGVIILLLVVPLTTSFSVSLDAESPANQVLEGRVIWGAEQTYKEMPAAQVDSPGYVGVIQYAIAQPVAYVGLMATRVGWEMAGVRPHFSLAHNAYVGLYLVPIYFFSLIGIMRYWRHPVVVLCASAFALHMLLVAITFADWSGRFLTYAWPLLCVCFGAGLTSLVNQKIVKQVKNEN